jgi:hypothetical protein
MPGEKLPDIVVVPFRPEGDVDDQLSIEGAGDERLLERVRRRREQPVQFGSDSDGSRVREDRVSERASMAWQ